MSERSKFPYDRAAALFDIVEKVSKVGPQYQAIANEAMAELKEMNQWLLDEQAKQKLEADRRAAVKATEANRQAQVEAEKQAKAAVPANPNPTVIDTTPGQPAPFPEPSKPVEHIAPTPIDPNDPRSPTYVAPPSGATLPINESPPNV